MPGQTPASAIDQLKKAGHRMTAARLAIIDAVLSAGTPVTAQDVAEILRTKKVSVNVTTIYRELEFLREEGILVPISFADGVQRYESSELGHHHHLICVECQSIQDIVVPHESVHAAEREIEKIHGFAVMQHALDFYGHCQKCR